MKMRIQVVVEADDGTTVVQEVAEIAREGLRPDTVGLRLDEAKDLLRRVQQVVVEHQIADHLARQASCPCCDRPRVHKGAHTVVLRTLFGTLRLRSPRLYHCPCQSQPTRTFSPLADVLSERTTPELVYLETKFAALVSYGLTVRLLEETLPLGRPLSPEGVRHHAHRVAARLEDELGEEKAMFAEGCPLDWAALPRPDLPLTVGIDGGYVHSATQTSRRDGWFGAIVGKSVTAAGDATCFGFVQTYDTKPKRRLFEVLRSQGMQMNQQVTFLTDGGDDVRDLPLYLNPQAEHLLDWFHVTARITVMRQHAKGLHATDGLPAVDADTELERIKWYLWHGNVFRAMEETEALIWRLESDDTLSASGRKLAKALDEFLTYLRNNDASIPNYGERWRTGEVISTAFAESTVNQVLSKRMVKKQQMRWTPRGAHLLLQVCTRVLNDELQATFDRWYPAMNQGPSERDVAA
jgi:hypothetical protein